MSKQIAKPNLTDILQELKLDIFNSFNCHRVGKINGFSSSNQTADIELVDKAIIPTSKGNQLIDFPLLTGCPVFVNKGSNGGFTRPITTGEYCLVLFNDRDIESWFNNGGINEPASSRTHNLTDCLVIVGIFSDSSPLGNYNNAATEMNFQDSIVSLDATKAKMSKGTTLVEVDSGEAKMAKGTTKISLDSKVGISNATQSLQTLIAALITVIDSLEVVDPISGNLPITSATSTALATALTNFNLLLKT